MARKELLLGDTKRAAGMLPFAYRLEAQLRTSGRRHVRREFLDLSWVEVTVPFEGAAADIRIFGGAGYGAGSYIIVDADYVRDGADTIVGNALTGGSFPGYVNYFVYVVDAYTGKMHRLFWFYGGATIPALAIQSITWDGLWSVKNQFIPRIHGYFFNDAHEGSTPLLHLHVDNMNIATHSIMYAEYLLVGEKRDLDFYTATYEGWQIWAGGYIDTWPQQSYGPTLEQHYFLYPAFKRAGNRKTSDDAKLWTYHVKTDSGDTPEFTSKIGYIWSNASYYGFSTSLWNDWIDFNNFGHFPYPIFDWEGPTAGWDVWMRPIDSLGRSSFDWANIDLWRLVNYRDTNLFFGLTYYDASENAVKEGIFSASTTSQTVNLQREVTAAEHLCEFVWIRCFLECPSANHVGFAVSLKYAATHNSAHVKFYVGASMASASFLFEIKGDDLQLPYDPNDPAKIGTYSNFWFAEAFITIRDTPGSRLYGFVVTQWQNEYGYPPVYGTYDEATNKVTILHCVKQPYTGAHNFYDNARPCSMAAESLGAGYQSSVWVQIFGGWAAENYSWATVPPVGSVTPPTPYPVTTPPFILIWEGGERLDLSKIPVRCQPGTTPTKLAMLHPRTTQARMFDAGSHTLPLWPT